MAFGAQAKMPAAKGTPVEAPYRRGPFVPQEKHYISDSHYQMTLRPSDSAKIGTSAIMETLAEVLRDKGPSHLRHVRMVESPLATSRRALAHAQDTVTTARAVMLADTDVQK